MGQRDAWVIFLGAGSGKGGVCLRWKGVLISWVLKSGFLGVFSLCATCFW